MRVPAVVAAGDRGAAKAIRGESKAYLSVGERPLVCDSVLVLQRVPEVSEVMVVGDAVRLEKTLSDPAVRDQLVKPLTIVPQFRNLYENAWETYRRLLPGAGPTGRDPASPPTPSWRCSTFAGTVATAQEISAFVRQSAATGADYALGLVTEESMEALLPTADQPGIKMAYFNLVQGRFRQNGALLQALNHRILEYTEVRQNFSNLEGADDPLCDAANDRLLGNVVPGKPDLTCCRPEQAAYEIEECRLACTVRTDYGA